MAKEKVKVGADIECFLFDSDAIVVPSQKLVEGTKEEPHRLSQNVYVHRDNVLCEFSVKPSTSTKGFSSSVAASIRTVSEYLKPKMVSLENVASYEIPLTRLIGNDEAMTFGCDPDFDAWGRDLCVPPDPLEVGRVRSAGGHVHIGNISDFTQEQRVTLIKLLDMYLMARHIADHEINDHYSESIRRRMYGRAGRYRLKPYGVEYRTPSNYWINSPERRRSIFNVVTEMVSVVRSNSINRHVQDCMNDEQFVTNLVDAINGSNPAACQNVLMEIL